MCYWENSPQPPPLPRRGYNSLSSLEKEDTSAKNWRENLPSVQCVNRATGSGCRFYADFVVCTFPLGVLKTCHETLFQPNLDEEKVSETGSINVIYTFISRRVFANMAVLSMSVGGKIVPNLMLSMIKFSGISGSSVTFFGRWMHSLYLTSRLES